MFIRVHNVTNLRITNSVALPKPVELCEEIPRNADQKSLVRKTREHLHSIIHGEDKRLLAVVGPCSIHDLKACREYAERFAALSDEVKDRLLLVMRVYFEKPRTTVGWKGLIMDPQMNGTCDIPKGLRIARTFLGDVLDLGIPTEDGQASAVTTGGNPDCQLILRGGAGGPNYTSGNVDMAKIGLETVKAPTSIMIDCSHANSSKDPSMQPDVLDDVLGQIEDGAECIHAVMIESHLKAGNQAFPRPVDQLEYGVSITDGCIDWSTTEACLRRAAEVIDKTRFN